MPSAAVIGLGNIGGLIARLAERSVPLTVFDLRPDAGDVVVAGRSRRAASSADAAADADVVIIVVATDQQVLDVISGSDGVLAGARPGTVLVLHSTVTLGTVREVAAQCAERGVRLIDAGVSTRGQHEPGTLALFVGGDPADVDAARPVLEHYAQPLDYLGPLGSGMAMKLVRNLLGYYLMASGYEALNLAERIGIDLDAFRRVLIESSPGDQLRMVINAPTTLPVTESQAVADYIKSSNPAAGDELVQQLDHMIPIMEKDIDDAVAFAQEVGVELVLPPHVRKLLRPIMHLPPKS